MPGRRLGSFLELTPLIREFRNPREKRFGCKCSYQLVVTDDYQTVGRDKVRAGIEPRYAYDDGIRIRFGNLDVDCQFARAAAWNYSPQIEEFAGIACSRDQLKLLTIGKEESLRAAQQSARVAKGI